MEKLGGRFGGWDWKIWSVFRCKWFILFLEYCVVINNKPPVSHILFKALKSMWHVPNVIIKLKCDLNLNYFWCFHWKLFEFVAAEIWIGHFLVNIGKISVTLLHIVEIGPPLQFVISWHEKNYLTLAMYFRWCKTWEVWMRCQTKTTQMM